MSHLKALGLPFYLFIDDERKPADATWAEWYLWPMNLDFIIARNFREVADLVSLHGFPDFVSFDHDLGDGEPTGHDIARWMVDGDLDGVWNIPSTFRFSVHSQNPIGKSNIEGLLNRYLKTKVSPP